MSEMSLQTRAYLLADEPGSAYGKDEIYEMSGMRTEKLAEKGADKIAGKNKAGEGRSILPRLFHQLFTGR